jgi:hypothetical protein
MLGLDTGPSGSGGFIDAAKQTAQEAATDSEATPGSSDDPIPTGVDPVLLAGGAVAVLALLYVVM